MRKKYSGLVMKNWGWVLIEYQSGCTNNQHHFEDATKLQLEYNPLPNEKGS